MPPDSTPARRARRTDTRPPQTAGDERSVLLGFLDHLREAVAAKADGAPDPQVRTPGVPSGTSVLGLVKHLTAVEGSYFLGTDVRNWAATMKPEPGETPEELIAAYRDVVRRANEVVATYDDLTSPAPLPARKKSAPSMRWLLVHMIEETGRHAGHADILREQIDGATGR